MNICKRRGKQKTSYSRDNTVELQEMDFPKQPIAFQRPIEGPTKCLKKGHRRRLKQSGSETMNLSHFLFIDLFKQIQKKTPTKLHCQS